MSDDERKLARLGEILSKVARPYAPEQELPLDVRAALWQLGVPCNDLTPREEVVAKLWARKRNLLMVIQPHLGGPTAPSAA